MVTCKSNGILMRKKKFFTKKKNRKKNLQLEDFLPHLSVNDRICTIHSLDFAH